MRRLLAFILIAALAAPLAADDDAAAPAARIRAEEAMEQTIDRPAISGTLEEVIVELSQLAGVTIQPDWQAIEGTGADRDTRVVIRSSRATVGQMLDIALLQASAENRPLAWYADGPAVHATTQMRAIYGRRRPRRPAPRPVRQQPARPDETPRAEAVQFRFDEVHLEDVIDFFRAVSGASFHVNWRALETVGVYRDTTVSMRLSDVSIGRALDVLCDDLSGPADRMQRVYWVVDEGVVRIATGEALNQTTRTRVFDVADLLTVAPDFPAPSLQLGRRDDTTGNGTRTGAGLFDDWDTDTNDRDDFGDEASLRRQRREQLISLIRESIGDDMWQPIGKGSIRLLGNQLVITQTPLGFRLLRDTIRAH